MDEAVKMKLIEVMDTQSVVVLACGISLTVAMFGVAHMVVMEFYTHILYSQLGILKRRFAVKYNNRYITENLFVYFFAFWGPSFVIAHMAKERLSEFDMSFNVIHVILNTWFAYVSFDFPYFFVHKAFHDIPFLYKHIHYRHHDDVATNVYVTGKAALIENVLAVSPFLSLWAWVVLSVLPTLNLCTLLLPALDLVMYFNIGHSGFEEHFLLNITRPLSFVIPFMEAANRRHEQHHVNPKKNYGPALPILDAWFGTNSVPHKSLYKPYGMHIGERKKE